MAKVKRLKEEKADYYKKLFKANDLNNRGDIGVKVKI